MVCVYRNCPSTLARNEAFFLETNKSVENIRFSRPECQGIAAPEFFLIPRGNTNAAVIVVVVRVIA